MKIDCLRQSLPTGASRLPALDGMYFVGDFLRQAWFSRW